MREFSQQELQEIFRAQDELREQGLIVDDKDGKSLVDHNAERIGAYFTSNPQLPVTIATVLAAVEQMKNQLNWKSREQFNFDGIYAGLTSQEKEAFNSWVRPQRLVNHYANNVAILKYLKQSQRYEVNHRTLLQAAVDRIAPQLEWEPLPRQVSERGHKDDGSGFLSKDHDPQYRAGRLNHAYVEPGSKQDPTPSLDQSEARWREMALALRGNTHSKNAELERIHGRSWRETYELRKKALYKNPVIITKMGAA